MSDDTKPKGKGNATGRIGIWIYPSTRNRLNKCKYDLTVARGRIYDQDETLNLLIDHFLATAPQGKIAEYA